MTAACRELLRANGCAVGESEGLDTLAQPVAAPGASIIQFGPEPSVSRFEPTKP